MIGSIYYTSGIIYNPSFMYMVNLNYLPETFF